MPTTYADVLCVVMRSGQVGGLAERRQKMGEWWLISNEVVEIVRRGLEASGHEANDYNCNPRPYETCEGCDGDLLRGQALHDFETGLHITECIPNDYR